MACLYKEFMKKIPNNFDWDYFIERLCFEFRGFSEVPKEYKFNFKNSLETIKTYIEELLFCPVKDFLKKIPLIFYLIVRTKQKIRPNRKYPRASCQLRNKWQLDRKIRREVVI